MGEKTCGNCSNGSAVATKTGHDTGFLRCSLMPSHVWLAGGRECSFQECRWQPKLEVAKAA